jgi:phosphatidylinositol-3-phosphatase
MVSCAGLLHVADRLHRGRQLRQRRLRPPRHLGHRPHPPRRKKSDQYAVRQDGFAFFASATANQAFCAVHILSFRPLPGDLARAATTPAFPLIVPSLGNDGHDALCVTGAAGGLPQADAFLASWVPKIMASPAYRDSSLIVVTFDEGGGSAACWGETSGFSPGHPNMPEPGKAGPGGGRTGAVLPSPSSSPAPSAPRATTTTRSAQHREHLPLPHLGDAGMPQVRSFGPDVFR